MEVYYSHSEEDKIRELLLWQSVHRVSENELELSNGTILKINPNEGCGGCSSGWYDLTFLAETINAITSVRFEETLTSPPDSYNNNYRFSIFVLSDGSEMKLLEVEGTDGNGYYGTGYTIEVELAKDTENVPN